MHLELDLERKLPRGLKAHSHEQRSRITAELVPLIQKHMGVQLLALAATGSFASKRDEPYSDLDFIGFVRDVQHPTRAVVNQIYDGLLIHVWFLTRDQYLDIHKRNIGDEWARGGAVSLSPILNAPFVRALSDASPVAEAPQYHTAILEYWPLVQAATNRVLSADQSGNEIDAAFLCWDLVDKITMSLALLNRTPFTTRAKVFSEARDFPLRPKSYDTLFTQESDFAALQERTLTVFAETERLLSARGLLNYAESLDDFVEPPRLGDSIRRHLVRVTRKLFASHSNIAISGLWPFTQEAASKVLNASMAENSINTPFLYWNMIDKVTKIVALLNGKIQSDRASVFSEAQNFAILPESYSALFTPLRESDVAKLRENALTVFAETEQLLQSQGLLIEAR